MATDLRDHILNAHPPKDLKVWEKQSLSNYRVREPAMATDQHRELHEILVGEGVGVPGMTPYTYPSGEIGWHEQEQCIDLIDEDHAHGLIERAAVMWLVGRGWMLTRDHLIPPPSSGFPSFKREEPGTLIEDLLAAAKREVHHVG